MFVCLLFLGLYLVVFGEDDGGTEGLGFFEVHVCVGHYYYGVAYLYFACCGSVEADAATSALTGYDVGAESLAVVVVDDVYALACDEVGGVHQVLVYGDATHVVEVGLGDLDAVELAFQYFYDHRWCCGIIVVVVGLAVSYVVDESYGGGSAVYGDAAYDA